MTDAGLKAPTVYTIPSGVSFVDALAQGIYALHGGQGDWHAIAPIRILVPTRRAVRSLQDAFRRLADAQGQGAFLLPKIQPIGDVDEEQLIFDGRPLSGLGIAEDVLEIPPAISTLRREFILAQLIVTWSKARQAQGQPIGATDLAQAIRLATELGRFLDGLQTEGVEAGALDSLVPDTYTEHWQETLDFLKIATEHWPRILQDEAKIDPADRRNRLIRGLAQRWQGSPPPYPVIAAGSTGSIPATADLLSVIANLPDGAVILPGLDLDLDDKAWAAIGPSHPQFGMKDLLTRLSVTKDQVAIWPFGEGSGIPQDASARRTLLSAALRPADATEDWRDVIESEPQEIWHSSVRGLTRVDAATSSEEAQAIALILREVLETPGKTAALVTPDRDLARRVVADLTRWDITIDDSAGRPLSQSRVGAFLRLVAEAADTDVSPISVLSLLKHPLCRLGFDRATCRQLVLDFERLCLRGPAPETGIEGLKKRLSVARESAAEEDQSALDDIEHLLLHLDEAITPFITELNTPILSFDRALRLHILSAEQIAVGEDGDPGGLWSGEDGEACAGFLSQVLDDGAVMPDVPGWAYAQTFETLIEPHVIRPTYGTHPRLFIYGPLEARLQTADVVILGGLNEGTWPGEARLDPWLSRPMRRALGLQLPERRVGLSAHDFVQLASSPIVYLTRAQRVDGAPTVASRWLLRMETLLRGAGVKMTEIGSCAHLAWARQLGEPGPHTPVPPPTPCPPLSARPRHFSATDIATWIRDPYAIYARKILNLSPLDVIAAEPDQLDRGILIHTILERFVRQFPDTLPEDAYDQLIAIGEQVFARFADEPSVEAFWWPRFERIAQWFVNDEKARRSAQTISQIYTEAQGILKVGAPGGDVILTARADRIDQATEGTIIYDYKTGFTPSVKQVLSHLEPQLALEALILAKGGFDGVPQGVPAGLAYIQLSGGAEPGALRVITKNTSETKDLLGEVDQGLQHLIAAYDNPDMPYRSRPRVKFISHEGPYDHLARVKEWPVIDIEGSGEGL